jgi:Ca2+-binding EF-hand superfamily protein
MVTDVVGKENEDPLETRADAIETALRQRLETVTGCFADEKSLEAGLLKAFKFFDLNGSGEVDLDTFFVCMTRLHFVGVQKELETLFDRYDEDGSGSLSYQEFARAVAGAGFSAKGSVAVSAIDRAKACILEKGGANGIRTLAHILRRFDSDGGGTLDAMELTDGLRDYGLELSEADCNSIFHFFDRDGNGRISLDELMKGLRGRMPRRRRALVRQAFSILDTSGDGVVEVEDIRACYQTSSHPDVVSGRKSSDQVLADMLAVYEQDVDGRVTFREFLEYHKDLSASIANDDHFELLMRNAWHISGGFGVAANSSCLRVLVHHADGSQSVEEVKNDLGLNPSDTKGILSRLTSQGVADAVRIEV